MKGNTLLRKLCRRHPDFGKIPRVHPPSFPMEKQIAFAFADAE